MPRKSLHVLGLTGKAGKAEWRPAKPTLLLTGEFSRYVHLTKEADTEGVRHMIQWGKDCFLRTGLMPNSAIY